MFKEGDRVEFGDENGNFFPGTIETVIDGRKNDDGFVYYVDLDDGRNVRAHGGDLDYIRPTKFKAGMIVLLDDDGEESYVRLISRPAHETVEPQWNVETEYSGTVTIYDNMVKHIVDEENHPGLFYRVDEDKKHFQYGLAKIWVGPNWLTTTGHIMIGRIHNQEELDVARQLMASWSAGERNNE